MDARGVVFALLVVTSLTLSVAVWLFIVAWGMP